MVSRRSFIGGSGAALLGAALASITPTQVLAILMGVVLLAGSFRLSAIVEAQERLWFVVP